MKIFTVLVTVVPPICSMKEIYAENRIIEGYTLKDAKKRAGIQ